MEASLAHLKANDKTLATLIRRYPVPGFKKHSNYYQELVESIISQQLSVKAAAKILERFRTLFSSDFPTPQQILEQNIEDLRSIGLSRQKATYIQDLASKVLDKTVSFETIESLSNQEIIDELTKVKGIGEWTVHMFLMFCMGRPDVLAHGDLGIRNGITKLYNLPSTATPDDVKRIAKDNDWHPYESTACWYIWQSLDNAPAKSVY